MGNHTCTCILGSNRDANTFKLEPDLYMTSQQCVQVEANLLQREQEGGEDVKNVKTGPYPTPHEESLNEDCPGVLLKSDQLICRVNDKVQKIEKELGPFSEEEADNVCNTGNIMSILYTDNSIYKGRFAGKWQRSGLGTLLLPDGSKFVGNFSENKMKGKGRLIYPDGDYYEGEFDDDKPNGKGLIVKATEDVKYKGDFSDGLKNGIGEESLADGSVYEGQFVQDNKTGKGKFIWADQTVYEGDFCNNEIAGWGKIIYPEMKIYIGNWKNNKIDGKGLFYWPDGRFYVGYYHCEKKNGFGIFLFNNGKRYEGFWNQGKQHGLGICYLKGVGRLGEWRFGKKIRWLCMDISTGDPGVKANISEINKKADELLVYMRQNKLPHFDEEDVKGKLLAYNINCYNES